VRVTQCDTVFTSDTLGEETDLAYERRTLYYGPLRFLNSAIYRLICVRAKLWWLVRA
jgi:hypothetical protein